MTPEDKSYRRQIYISLVIGYIILGSIGLFIAFLFGVKVTEFSSIFIGATSALTAFVISAVVTTPKSSK